MAIEAKNFNVLTPKDWSDYELVDSGNEQRLERFGNYFLARPEKQALWQPTLPQSEWNVVHAVLQKAPGRRGEWKFTKDVPKKWPLSYDDLNFWIQITHFGHIGVFPEQAAHWEWIIGQVSNSRRQLQVLNLFGYTGIATLAAARSGARITHVDASKPTITWAADNQKLSHLENRPIRWIIDDAIKFVKREEKRGVKYDAIIADPPKFGRGPKGEIWRFEDSFVALMQECKGVLSPNPQFVVVNAYDIPISAITLGNVLTETMQQYGGLTECGELALRESASQKLLSTSVYSRWSKK